MEYTYRFRIYPSRKQENLIEKTFGCCRYVYNHYLQLRFKSIYDSEKPLTYHLCANDLTLLKDKKKWLRDVDSTALQSALYDQEIAFQNYYRRRRQGYSNHKIHFRKKRSVVQSYRTKRTGTNIEVTDRAIKLPKLGWIKCKVSRQVHGRILSVIVKRMESGRYYVCIVCNVEEMLYPETGKSIVVTTGQNEKEGFEQIRFNEPSKLCDKRLQNLKDQLSRKPTDSKRKQKLRQKIAKEKERIIAQRTDQCHNITSEIVKGYDTIYVLKPKENPTTFWNEFQRQLSYKSRFRNRTMIVLNSIEDVPFNIKDQIDLVF